MSVPSPSKKILVLDDEEAIVELLVDILEVYNYEVIPSTKWTEALDAIGHQQPDLILLDLKMPTIDGSSFLEFIRKEGIDLPVIIVSGFITDEASGNLSKLGVSGFVRKPFRARQITTKIDRVLGTETSPEPSGDATAPPAGQIAADSFYRSPPEPAPEPAPPLSASPTGEVLQYG